MGRKELGNLAERLAAEFLAKRGYAVLERNYRRPWGELDIVARRGKVVIFVEVKASGQSVAGFEPELRAGAVKLHKVARTAQTYLSDKGFDPQTEWRVDVITVVFDTIRGTAKIKHFPNVEVA